MGNAGKNGRDQRAERRERTRTKIIEATIASVAEKGAAGASLGAIMKRAKISKGLVGYHFGTKDQLLVAAFGRLCDDFRAVIGVTPDGVPSAEGDVERQLDEMIRRTFEGMGALEEDRQYAWFGFWALARAEPTLRAMNREMYGEVARYLGQMLACVAAKRGRTIDEDAAGHELSATLDGAWLHLTTRVEGFAVDDAIEMCRAFAERLLEREWGPRATAGQSSRTFVTGA
jgi:TetR/AcrR family transcriptional repressor of bet genes